MRTIRTALAGTALLAATLAFAQEPAPAAATPEAAPAPEAAAEAAPAPAKELKYSNKWRIEVSEGSNNDGELHFQVTPKDGAAQDVKVQVTKGMGENTVARTIEKSFESTLDKKKFHVEVDDGEDVLVKKRSGPDFALVLIGSNLKGTRINIEKE